MKTIEMKVGNKDAVFTTKSVTIDGTEYFYGKMSEIKHSASKHVYAFTYNGEKHYLPYDPKYDKILNAIFMQVKSLHSPKAQAKPAAEAPQPEAKPVVESQTDAPAEAVAEVPATEAEAVAEVSETEAKPVEAETEAPKSEAEGESVFSAVPAETEAKTDEVAAEVTETEAKPVEATAEAADGEDKNEELPAKAEDNAFPVDAATEEARKLEKKAKLKKSLLILIGIVLLIAVMTGAYFKFFGTTKNPTAGPNSGSTEQYDNIDELIDDLD